jgi:hypothetical protein
MKAVVLFFLQLFLFIGLSPAQECSDVETGYLTIEKGIVDDTLGSVWISTGKWYSDNRTEEAGKAAFDIARRLRRWQAYFPEKEVEAIVPFSAGGQVSPIVGILVLYRYRTTEVDRRAQSVIDSIQGLQVTRQ